MLGQNHLIEWPGACRTTQRLENSIKQRVSYGAQSNDLTHSTYSCNQNTPSITQHILANAPYMTDYKPNMIIIESSTELQLSVLEVLYITKFQPILCKQKDFYNLFLFNPNEYTTIKSDLIQKKKTKKNHTNPSRYRHPTILVFFSLLKNKCKNYEFYINT